MTYDWHRICRLLWPLSICMVNLDCTTGLMWGTQPVCQFWLLLMPFWDCYSRRQSSMLTVLFLVQGPTTSQQHSLIAHAASSWWRRPCVSVSSQEWNVPEIAYHLLEQWGTVPRAPMWQASALPTEPLTRYQYHSISHLEPQICLKWNFGPFLGHLRQPSWFLIWQENVLVLFISPSCIQFL